MGDVISADPGWDWQIGKYVREADDSASFAIAPHQLGPAAAARERLSKRMVFAGIKIVTLSEGEISPLHVGLKGTMHALFLKDLADKVRRGLRGRVEHGQSGGGSSYGYDVVRKLDGNGELVRRERAINAVEADIVRRIFRDYATGKSGQRIAAELNKEGIAAPTRSTA